MGIPRFIAALKNRYPNAFSSGEPNKLGINTLSIDFNSLIHEAAMEVYAYGKNKDLNRQKVLSQMNPATLRAQLIISIGTRLTAIIKLVEPTDVLILAVDGVATMAKIQQQRQRRYRSAIAPSSPLFDNSCITPGTEFMIELDSAIQNWIYSE